MARLEDLTSEHFREWGSPFIPQDIVGYAMRNDDGGLICLGGIWFIDGRAWATFASKEAPPPRVHQHAARLLEEIKNAGVKEVWAELDESKPKARKWLERFKFEHHSTNEDGIKVWRLALDGRPSHNGRHGSKHRDVGLRVNPRG
jgi:hypothetical protein